MRVIFGIMLTSLVILSTQTSAQSGQVTEPTLEQCVANLGARTTAQTGQLSRRQFKPPSIECFRVLPLTCLPAADPSKCLAELTAEYDRRTFALADLLSKGIDAGKVARNEVTLGLVGNIKSLTHAERVCGPAAVETATRAGLPIALLLENCGAAYQWFQGTNLFLLTTNLYRNKTPASK